MGARLKMAKRTVRQVIMKMVIANSFVMPQSIGVHAVFAAQPPG
jgi:hypothetical protein